MAKAARETGTTGGHYAGSIVAFMLSVVLTLSLLSYDWHDVKLLHVPPREPPSNFIGPIGALLAFGLFFLFGVAACLLPIFCLGAGLALALGRGRGRPWARAAWAAGLFLSLVAVAELSAPQWQAFCRHVNIADAGGVFGRIVVRGLLIEWISPVGTAILAATVLLVCAVMLAETRNLVAAGRAVGRGCSRAAAAFKAAAEKRRERRREEAEPERTPAHVPAPGRATRGPSQPKPKPKPKPKPRPEPSPEADQPAVVPEAPPLEPEAEWEPPPMPVRPAAPGRASGGRAAGADKPSAEDNAAEARTQALANYELPPVALLRPAPRAGDRVGQADTEATARAIVETLSEFGIEAEAVNVERGPVVTRYELAPAPGVRVERISGLANNLALSLKATSVRVQAPVPGKGVVGVEVPNDTAKLVYLRELVEGARWKPDSLRLPLALGKDVGGNDLVADLAEMPHLLIAGATGSGKTVCMNSILAGLLVSRTPEEMKLLLVDPKIVEFAAYQGLPHLAAPVITDAKKVSIGLRWAINEMEKRYKLFAKVGVRNIAGYNSREIARQEDLFSGLPAADRKDSEPPEKVPYIVVVIDELADLMLADGPEIENCVARLAQLSRAVGIHMIIATQRPSVNVITGTIKANFPARIAFQVAQRVDSRTILDTVGADKLLGRGDMLFQPPGTSKLIRAQGAMTTDEEINRVVEAASAQAEPEYDLDVKDKSGATEGSGAGPGPAPEDEAELNQAIEIIRETRRASTSSLQRRMRIGYNKAARLMDLLEERGVVGPPRGSDPREILIDLDGEIPENAPPEED